MVSDMTEQVHKAEGKLHSMQVQEMYHARKREVEVWWGGSGAFHTEKSYAYKLKLHIFELKSKEHKV